MKNDEMLTLGLFELKSQTAIDPYEVFTCEDCEAGTCERIGRCPKCGGRLLDSEAFESRLDGRKSGFIFIVYGLIYLIFPAIFMYLRKPTLTELAAKASAVDYLSVSQFTSLFGFSICMISVGLVMLMTRNDSLLTKVLAFLAVVTFLGVLDFVVFPALR